MTVLRSHEILPTKPETEPVKSGANIVPATPSQTREAAAIQETGSVSFCRRSARLASKSSVSGCPDKIVEQCFVKSKRKLGMNEGLLSSESEDGGGCLNLRSGKKVAKRLVEEDFGNEQLNSREIRGKRKGKLEFEVEDEKKGKITENEEGVDMENLETERIESHSGNRTRRFTREEKGKGKLEFEVEDEKKGKITENEEGVDMENLQTERIESHSGNRTGSLSREEKEKGKLEFEVEDEKKGKITENEGVDMENLETKRILSFSGNSTRRFSREEKGNGKLVVDDSVLNGSGDVEGDLEDEVKILADVSGESVVGKSRVKVSESRMERRSSVRVSESRMEQFRDIARQNATRFAVFSEQEQVSLENEREIEDWPGPFSTAMKIIRDRDDKLKRKHGNNSLENKNPTAIPWIPKTGQGRSKLRIPSLKELCLNILVQNADALTSLENVPDALRHKLSVRLCSSRRMNSHFLDLLVTGSPTEIRLCECSWLTEEQFTKSFQDCDTRHLTVLQLDYCGRLPDYILLSALVRSSNSLPSLTTLSLCGASRLSDAGLQGIVSSAPALRCVNLSECSFVTTTSIGVLANSLGSVMHELYINDCQNVDAMLILPALNKLKCLEVLSVAGIETVSDDFIREFISVHGHNMKELVLSECVKLTDISLKAIAETCTGLRALNIYKLCRLTDFSIGYLANGCQAIQKLNVGYNAFSDEAIAAFLETSGESLKELSLNSVKVAHNTAVSLAKRSRNLLSLDISFCRNLTNEAVGLIVDSCLSLKILKVFGCTQITNVFLEGHSNTEVQIIGLQMSPLLKQLKVPDYDEVPLRYSSALI